MYIKFSELLYISTSQPVRLNSDSITVRINKISLPRALLSILAKANNIFKKPSVKTQCHLVKGYIALL